MTGPVLPLQPGIPSPSSRTASPSRKETPIITRRRFPHVYFGWWTVIVSGIVCGIGTGFYSLGISALFKPIASELSLSREAASLATGIGRLQGGIEAPLTGWLSDRYGPRYVIIGGFCVFLSGLVLMYFVTQPWQYYMVWGILIGVGHNLALTIAFDKALTNWFIGKSGLAFGLRFGLLGTFAALVVPIISWLVVGVGWRMTCLVWAVVMLAALPITVHFVKKGSPEDYGLLPDGVSPLTRTSPTPVPTRNVASALSDGSQTEEFTLRQALKTRTFWLIVLVWACFTLVFGAFNVHCIPFLTDMGISPTVAGGMMAMMVFLTVPSRFLGGFLADRVRRDRLHYLAMGAFFLQAAGIAAFLMRPSVGMAYGLLLLYGFGSGAPTSLRMTMGGQYFGRRAYASIMGMAMFLNAPLSLAGPIYVGWLFDTTGSYAVAFSIFTVLLALATVAAFFIRPPGPLPRPVGAADLSYPA